MSTEAVRFNKSTLGALVKAGESITVKDTEVSDLKFKVGKKRSVFFFEKRISGKPKQSAVTITMGAFPAISIEDARQAARKLASKCEMGIDPRDEKESLFGKGKSPQSQEEKTKEPDITLQACITKFFEVKTGLRKRTISKYKTEIKHRFPRKWNKMNINDITSEMLVAQFHIARRTARERCFEFLKVFSNIWNTCAPLMLDDQKKRVLGLNPVPDARQTINHIHRDEPSRPYIAPEHIGPFFSLVEKMSQQSQEPLPKVCSKPATSKKPPQVESKQKLQLPQATQRYCQMILLSLFTGLRGIEARHLKWSYVDLDLGFITLPGKVEDDTSDFEGTKNHHEHAVPLSTYAWQLLRDIHKNQMITSEYVFPSLRCAKKPMRILAVVNKHISKGLGGIPFAFHSCRRTFACIGEEVGLDLFKIKRALNHSYRGGVTGIYINPQFNRESQRKNFELIGGYILQKRDELDQIEQVA